MKKILLIQLAAILFFMPLSAEAFSLAGLKKAASVIAPEPQQKKENVSEISAASAVSQLAALNSQLEKTDAASQEAFLSLVSLLSSKQEADAVQSKIQAVMSDKNAGSINKNLIISQLISNYAADLQKNKTEAASLAAKTAEADKALLAQTLQSLNKTGLEYASLASKYAALTQASSSISELAETIPAVKEAVSSIKSRTSALSSLAAAAGQLLK